jgi:16S rRNA G966 N2-methylase RsmD
MELKIEYLPIKALKPYEKNTRKHQKKDVDNIARSIEKYGMCDAIGIWGKQNIIVEGHGRMMACKQLGMTEVPCVRLDHLTDEQRREYAIAHNATAELSEWDLDVLPDELAELDLSDFDFDFGIEDEEEETETEYSADDTEHKSLVDRFIAPPFSILDTRQGYWQDRKRQWKDLGIKSDVGRDAECMQNSFNEKYGREQQTGTSIFDPVLCELAYKWFCTEGGKIYDCFAGGSVRGIVAAKLGYDYHGIDLRQEQIDANIANAKEIGVCPNWYCDDSLNADQYVADESCDLVFSCPPYADLEVYSDDPRDISNMDYDGFCKVYADIIAIACRKLKQDRFAVFVVGDVRDKKGFYRNFVVYTKKCFNDNGCMTYNEAILVDMLGTAMLRANGTFKSRKLVKVHQNVLVFYKGNPKNIKNNFAEIEIEDALFDD